MRTVACPPADQLSAYVVGKLPPDLLEAVSSHVDHCPACETSLHTLEQLSDPLLTGLRRPVPAQTWLGEPQLKAALGQAESLTSDSAPSIAHALPTVGRLGPYELIEKAGQGGMGVVWKARHTLLDRIDAVKVLPNDRTSDTEAVRRFLREMKVVGQLSHPNLIQARYADQIDGTWLLVTDWVDGETLAQRVQRQGPMLPAEACNLVCQAALGLQHAHERGVVHRDIKPSNLMCTSQGQLKVLDLGLARLRGEFGLVGDATGSGMILGTADYIAPEQIGEARHADHRADVYSLGCTLYYLLSGRLPFPKHSALEKLLAHQQHEPEPLARVCRGLPAGLAEVVARMMAKDVARRPQTMTEVIAALRPFVGAAVFSSASDDTALIREQALAEMSREPAPLPAASRPRSRLLVLGVLALAACVLIAAGVIFKLQGKNGTVVVEVMEADVEVLVDGEKITIQSKKAGPIELRAGEHEIIVKRGDETLYTQSFRMEKGKDKIIQATWKPRQPAPVAATPAGPLDALDPKDIPPNQRFDWQPGELVAVLGQHRPEGKQAGIATHVAFSPDGRRLVSGSRNSSTVVVWDVLKGQELKSFKMQTIHGATAVSFSPTGKEVLAVSWHVYPRVWDVETGQEASRLGHDQPAAAHLVLGGTYLPDGRIVTAQGNRPENTCTLRLWDAKTGKEEKAFNGHTSWYIPRVAASPDGRYLLSGGDDRTLRLWDVQAGKELDRFEEKGDRASVSGVACAPRGGLAASCGTRGIPARLWTIAAGRLRLERVLEGDFSNDRMSTGLAFSPDGKTLAGGLTDGGFVLWDCATGKQLLERRWAGDTSSLAFSLDGRHLAVANNNGTIYVVRLAPPSGKPREPDPIEVSPPGPLDRLDPAQVPQKERFDWQPKELVAVLGQHPADIKQSGLTSHVAFSPDGRRLVSGGNSANLVVVWDVLEQRVFRTFKMAKDVGAAAVSFAPTGQEVFAGGWHDHGRVWDVETGQERTRLGPEQGAMLHVILDGGYLSDGRIVTSHRDRHDGPCTLKLWDARTGKEVKAFSGHSMYVYSVAASPDSRLLLSGGKDLSLRLWNTADGKQADRFDEKAGDSVIQCVAFSGRGGLAASGGGGVPTRLWQVGKERLEQKLVLEGPPRAKSVTTLAFSPDGRLLAAGTEEGRLYLWECTTGKLVREWQWRAFLTGLSWAPDSRHLATANGNGTIYILRLAGPK